jgi:tubulin monoglycylase TTLL3/8
LPLQGKAVQFAQYDTADQQMRKVNSLLPLSLKILKTKSPSPTRTAPGKMDTLKSKVSPRKVEEATSTMTFQNKLNKTKPKEECGWSIQNSPPPMSLTSKATPSLTSLKSGNTVNNKLLLETKLLQLNTRNEIINMKKQFVHGTDIHENEKLKIKHYFRNRLATFIKTADEKIKKNMQLYKPKIQNKNRSVKDISSTTTPQNGTLNTETSYCGVEDQVKDDVWKALKRIVSTKSKYKFRDVINFEKRLQSTMKTLTYSRSPKFLKSPTRVSLMDEEDSPKKKAPEKNHKASSSDYPHSSGGNKPRRFDSNAKVFIIIGGYGDLRAALESRGWIENTDPTSKVFNLKWTLKKVDLNFLDLMPHQIVNHFEKNTSITTKVGLARNIRNLTWSDPEDVDNFYPRCFDLNDISDFDDFLEDFKFSLALSILKSVNPQKLPNGTELDLLKLKSALAIDICERHMKSPEALMAGIILNETLLVTQNEWDILNAPNFNAIYGNKKFEQEIKKSQNLYALTFGNANEQSTTIEGSLDSKICSTLKEIEKHHPQHTLTGEQNIWIIKPAGLSRGRGICCYNNLGDILDHIRVKESEWVAQKYIENPMIILDRKFDIRQWVLVTDWNPLTIWFYDECYVRFSADTYNPKDLGNRFSHLTNNSIVKHSEKFDTSEIDGNMWTCAEFAKHCQKLAGGKDDFYEKIQPKMKQMVIKSVQCVQDMVENRKNSFELYGYDFMIDDGLKPWLIEINSSPAMDYSTTVTERLVKLVLEDAAKVIVDYGMQRNKSKKVDTGLFKCIHEGKPF